MSHPQVTRLVPHGDLNDASTDVYAFWPVCVDVARHSVTRDGQPIALAPKTFELVVGRTGGRVLARQELIASLWPDTFVEQANLSFEISPLREALVLAARYDEAIDEVRCGVELDPSSLMSKSNQAFTPVVRFGPS